MSLTDAEIREFERLFKEQEHFERTKHLEGLDNHNPNYIHLRKCLIDSEISAAELAGSSRSGKTYSGVDFIIYLCLFIEKSCTINVYREVYASFKDTLYDDFKNRLDHFDLDNPFHNAKEVKSFKIGKNKITFIGCDKVSKAHGAGCDYAFFNEVMHIDQPIFKQVTMRCKKFWWADYNPSFTDHWFFDTVSNRPDVSFLRTTFLDNKFIPEASRLEILRSEPWESGTYKVTEAGDILYLGIPITESNQPPPNIDNIEQGTADEFHWKVYGLGLKGSMKGQIFKLVTWIDEFPDIAFTYGLDFGFVVDPLTLVKYAREGRNVYLELLIYQPIETAIEVDEALKTQGVSKYVPITADSSDKYVSERKGTIIMVSDLFDMGWEISKVSKTKNIMYHLLDMKKYKIHIVKNHLYKYAKKEKENYIFKTVNGIQINQPEDKHNHFWDGSRYAHMSHDINNFEVEYN